MLIAYHPDNGQLVGTSMADGDALPDSTLWLDLIGGSPEARTSLANLTGIDIPSAEAIEEIESTSRFFTDDFGVHLRSYFLCGRSKPQRNVTVAFILNKHRLVTLRNGTLASFRRIQEQSAGRTDTLKDPAGILLALFEHQIDGVADTLEQIHEDLDTLNQDVFIKAEAIELEQAMRRLAASQDLNDKVRLSLFDQQRGLSFLMRMDCCDETHKLRLREILQDIDSLTSHSTFLFEKVGFLVDAIRGQINLQENHVLKRLSVLGAMLLPPTLIAAIYGMNFTNMPELSWDYGYPMALGLMLLSSALPLAVFHYKRWL